ncbi:methyltransferase domain-containing protein [Paenibacillus methanolicus]|uniref:Small RNA 2'-O-methyltransferase n=1 Tax=Paenibacillus methanolicus TaxID=582686 RepID=A0A5S5BMJ0_9BACL|nr:methyltransferase domain-containing protein [Paenibacillus methanolicus]TYP68345.1 methyltransferase family protein [Paenibacillus methanolicus]
MQLIIRADGAGANMLSHLLAKNPNNLYEREEKGAKVRLVYTVCDEQRTEAVLHVSPDPIELVKGSPDSYDITQYINDREFVTSSLFCAYIRASLGTALNGKPKEAFAEWVSRKFALTLSFGPVASNLPEAIVEQLFAALGYEVEQERGEADYPFALKNRSSVRYITLRGSQTLQTALRQLFILMPVLDDYKHYFIGEAEVEKLERYGEGWLEAHPQRELIVKRTLRYADVIERYEARKPAIRQQTTENKAEQGNTSALGARHEAGAARTSEPGDATDAVRLAREMVKAAGDNAEEQSAEGAAIADGASGPQPKVRLNEQRYEAICDVIRGFARKRAIVDFGSGEGKLSARLAELAGVQEVLAVEPSAIARKRAMDRYAKLAERGLGIVPKPVTGSLFYYDESLRGKDVIVLCEVIEHIEAYRVERAIATILNEYAPHALIVTTPNREYNAVYEMGGAMRHADHRFEWTRGEFRQACERWRTDAYEIELQGVGEGHEAYGHPTQMAIFRRREETKEA